ncbi:hypothetical protein FA10DRAFT_265873 [Acaromyces ingoldii]|uniref:Casein kinase II subunit beta n=1 Tax=Acaromyces ingoldii TaxID=215250 RepID=A0A316YTT3_9BASI|nr:hypothetical protein FA10DRAFT_265873 [Acaromyces ingoldii]PWN92068.1 hypothetical protein FA10DRAFT_265873 [Acaromyces ingoldii]
MADEVATSDGRGRRGSGVASATAASKAADGLGEGEVAGVAASGSGAGQDGPAQERDPGLEEDEEEEEEEEEEEGGDAAAQGAERQAAGEGDAAQDDEMAVPFEDDMYESESDSGTDSLTWISWFCSLPGHEYFAEVSEDFIEDDFNLTGLNALTPFYKEALEMILDVEPQEDSLKIPDVSIVESSAELLYGLIHQRYILTRQGLQQMAEKYEQGHFGFCPRVFCHSHPVLPCGRSDLPGLDTVKLFCANCVDNYTPPSSRFHAVDGAFFGTTFPHLLFQTYRDLAPSPIAPPGTNYSSLNAHATQTSQQQRQENEEGSSNQNGSAVGSAAAATSGGNGGRTRGSGATASTLLPSQIGQRVPQARLYTPRIYGFRVSEHAKSGPRMRWMRMRPESFEELDTGIAPAPTVPSAAATGASDAIDEDDDDDDEEGGGGGAGAATNVASVPGVVDGRSTATGRPVTGRSGSAGLTY